MKQDTNDTIRKIPSSKGSGKNNIKTNIIGSNEMGGGRLFEALKAKPIFKKMFHMKVCKRKYHWAPDQYVLL